MVVPLQVVIGATSYDEGADGATPDMVAEALQDVHAGAARRGRRRRRCSDVYEAAAEDGAEEIVSVHLSGEMSGTFESAQLAARDAPVPVLAVDTRQVGFATGFAALAAAAVAAMPGARAEEAAEAALARAEAATSLFYVDTLEYLRRGGRIGAAAALLGGALAVKPLLQIDDGRVAPLEKVRTRLAGAGPAGGARGRGRRGRGRSTSRVAHLASPDRAEQLAAKLADAARATWRSRGAVRRARRGARRPRRAGHGRGRAWRRRSTDPRGSSTGRSPGRSGAGRGCVPSVAACVLEAPPDAGCRLATAGAAERRAGGGAARRAGAGAVRPAHAHPPSAAPLRSRSRRRLPSPGRRRSRCPGGTRRGGPAGRPAACSRGRVALGPGQLAVVAVVVALALAATAWWVLRGGGRVELPRAGRRSGRRRGRAAGAPSVAGPSVRSVGRARRPRWSSTWPARCAARASWCSSPVPGWSTPLEAAGGARRGVDLAGLNLARLLVDGEQIVVGVPPPPGPAAVRGGLAGPGPGALVNLNTATPAELEALPGVGPVTAAGDPGLAHRATAASRVRRRAARGLRHRRRDPGRPRPAGDGVRVTRAARRRAPPRPADAGRRRRRLGWRPAGVAGAAAGDRWGSRSLGAARPARRGRRTTATRAGGGIAARRGGLAGRGGRGRRHRAAAGRRAWPPVRWPRWRRAGSAVQAELVVTSDPRPVDRPVRRPGDAARPRCGCSTRAGAGWRPGRRCW